MLELQFPNLILVLPEIFLLSMLCIVLLADLFVGVKWPIVSYVLAQFSLLATLALTLWSFPTETTLTFYDAFVSDPISGLLKVFVLATAFFVFIYSRDYVKTYRISPGEYYVLGLFSVLGMLVLVSANDLLVTFLGIELLSLPLYAMVAIRRDVSLATEGAIKYFVTGALASGMLLYGMSMIYGATGSLGYGDIASSVSDLAQQQNLPLAFGLIFLVAGIAFKLGAAPFHMWVPDVYQGAPNSVTLFVGSAPKIATLGLAIRLLIKALPDLQAQWQPLLIIIAMSSITLGNVVAIVQTNIKRMLAYSAISHMGYMSLGLIAGTNDGYAAATFYAFAYSIMTLGAFGMLVLLSHSGLEIENIADLRGLNTRNPWLAFMLLLAMFSMAGIPPTVGFFAKLGVLEALIQVNLVWLAIYALLFAIIGAYYYITVVKVMYFEEPIQLMPISVTKDSYAVITLNGLAILLFGMFPSTLIDCCRQAFMS